MRIPGVFLCVLASWGALGLRAADALPRQMVRDFPFNYCPVHGGKAVSDDGLEVLFAEPTRLGSELRFTATASVMQVTLSTCSGANVLQPQVDLRFDDFAVVREDFFAADAHQRDRRDPTLPAYLRPPFLEEGGAFPAGDCYQSSGTHQKTVGSVFDPGLKAGCGPANPDCPFADGFENAALSEARWTRTGAATFVSGSFSRELSFPPSPACSKASVTLRDLVPGERYVVDFNWQASQELQQGAPLITADVHLPASKADFNRDGQTDVLWRNQATGALATWIMNGTVATSATALDPSAVADTRWHVEGVGDFDGDGTTDLVWRNQVSGELGCWLLDGTALTGPLFLTPPSLADTSWKIEGVADFDLDGKPDLLFRNQASGVLFVLFMSGTVATRVSILTPNTLGDPAWHVEGVADFNGDGKPDLLFRHQTLGVMFALFLDGTVATGASLLNPSQVADPSWKIEEVGDFNGDGKADLLWRNQATGVLFLFFMNGAVATGAGQPTPPQVSSLDWKIESH